MKVSVVIPLYNKVRHIARTINSVLTQTFLDFELIVVDDGSTDKGGDVVRQITDPRLRLITQDNAGVSAARNRGIQEAHTGLVAFLDADDEWLPEFLEIVMGLFKRHPEAGIFATAYRCCDGKKNWHPGYVDCPDAPPGGLLPDYFRSSINSIPVCSSAVMIPKRVLNEIGFFPVGIGRGEDLNTWARIALRYRVAWSPVVGAIYHLSSDNRACVHLPIDLNPNNAFTVSIEDFLRSPNTPLTSRRNIEEYCVKERLNYAIICCLNGQRSLALAHLARTDGSLTLRKKRMFMYCIVWIPVWLIKALIYFKQILHIKHSILRNNSH